MYALGGVLFAVPFDLRRLDVTGGPVPIVEGVRQMQHRRHRRRTFQRLQHRIPRVRARPGFDIGVSQISRLFDRNGRFSR